MRTDSVRGFWAGGGGGGIAVPCSTVRCISVTGALTGVSVRNDSTAGEASIGHCVAESELSRIVMDTITGVDASLPLVAESRCRTRWTVRGVGAAAS
jgi:hypothetical protein